MAYPTTTPGIESYFEPFDGTSRSRSMGGAGQSKDRFGGDQRGVFMLRYVGLTESERDAFWTDYDSDPGQFSFTWDEDASTHTVIYYGQPSEELRADANLWDMTIRLAKVPSLGGDLLLESGDVLLMESGDDLLLEG